MVLWLVCQDVEALRTQLAGLLGVTTSKVMVSVPYLAADVGQDRSFLLEKNAFGILRTALNSAAQVCSAASTPLVA
jgi:hypothetical protein